MTQAARIPQVPTDAAAALREVTAFAEAIVQTLRLSRAFLRVGRMICLDGLDALVAQLCARSLGLERQAGASLRLHLLAVQVEVDAIQAIMVLRQKAAACPSTIS